MGVSRWTELWAGPSLSREVREAIAERVVRWVLPPLCCIAIYTAVTIYVTIGFSQPTRYVPSVIACLSVSAVVWQWHTRRWLTAAATLSGTAALAILSAVLLNSVHAPAYWAGLLLMSLVVPLFGLRWGIVTALGLAAAGCMWIFADQLGVTTGVVHLPAITSYVQYLGYLVIGLIVFAVPHRLLIDALKDADRRRVEAETARQAGAQAELAFHAVFDQSNMALALLHSDGRIAELNQRAATWLGATETTTLVGQPLATAPLWNDEQRPQLQEAVQAAANGQSSQHELVLTAADGRRGVHQINISPFNTPAGGLGYVIIQSVDVTDLVETRSMLAQARRLEALGKLSGAVAHDFNNMLAAISGGCELVKIARNHGNLERVDENLGMIQSSVLRAADLTKKLLAFGRQDRFNTEPLNLNRLVVDIALLFERTLRKNIRVVVDTQPTELYVRADAAALEHALLNLALNAQDAMPDGGSLSLSTRSVLAREVWSIAALRDELRENTELVVISVADTGIGMSDDVRERLFEPFFTTKAVGKGTGLGLAAVHGTVRSHRGAITVQSREGQGSLFELYFPAAEPVRLSTPARSDISPTAPVDARILLADDEPLVRTAVTAMLEAAGCKVTAVEDGRALLDILATGSRPDAIITDLAMPGLDGVKLVQAIETACPGCPLLLITGFSGQDISSAFSGRSQHRLLRKPFTRYDLLRTLQKLINTSRQQTIASLPAARAANDQRN
jgi:PAS domain S-box-containing protein